MLASLLLPNAFLRLDDIEISGCGVTIVVTSTQTEGKCPVCCRPAQRVHSRYVRTLVDLPLSSQRVRIRLRARRFFCSNPSCKRTTFTEQLPDFAPKSARRTKRWADIQTVIGLALGGEAGARLVQKLEKAYQC